MFNKSIRDAHHDQKPLSTSMFNAQCSMFGQNGLKICPAIVSHVMSGDRYALDFEAIDY